MRSSGWNSRLAVALAVLAFCCTAGRAGHAQTAPRPPDAGSIARGKQSFRDHCAVCHGNEGHGNGPAARALTSRPTDLSLYTKRTGSFPAAKVEAAIRGTDPVVAHGIPGMMVWGAIFRSEANGNEARAGEQIADLVAFIQSIQTK